MRQAGRGALFFGGMGLFLGALPAALAAGAYATWRFGGNLTQIDPLTIAALVRAYGLFREPMPAALGIGGGVILASALAAIGLGYRPRLTSHGTARWAEPSELRRLGLLARPQGILGPVYAKLGPPGRRAASLSTPEIAHSLVAAPTGAGKGTWIVIPTLLTYNGSVLCLDLKGENFAATARRRMTSLEPRSRRGSPWPRWAACCSWSAPIGCCVRCPEARAPLRGRRGAKERGLAAWRDPGPGVRVEDT